VSGRFGICDPVKLDGLKRIQGTPPGAFFFEETQKMKMQRDRRKRIWCETGTESVQGAEIEADWCAEVEFSSSKGLGEKVRRKTKCESQVVSKRT
jgi:hypothetical protein